MFLSKSRKIIYPQHEHARLAGIIAHHWGNEQFNRPDLPFNEFCTGVALHDFGYGLLDVHDITGMRRSERHQVFQSLVSMQLNNPVVEIVAKTHVARLLNWAGLQELEAGCRNALKQLINSTGVPEAVFQDADTITRLCDSIAFDFCFERATSGSMAVMSKQAESNRIEVHYEIDFLSKNPACNTTGHIAVKPWPLSTDIVKGYLLAYDQCGYPDTLKPHWVEFELRPG